MAVTREEKEARRLWEEHCKRVQSLTELSPEAEKETRAERDARIRRLLANYPAFCEYYFPHYMRRTDPATGLVTGIVHMAPPSTMPPSVGGCGRRRSLPDTRKACTRPYSQASADAPGQALPRGAPRHLHSHQPHGARRWGDPLRARNAGLRNLARYTPHRYPANFAGVRRRRDTQREGLQGLRRRQQRGPRMG